MLPYVTIRIVFAAIAENRYLFIIIHPCDVLRPLNRSALSAGLNGVIFICFNKAGVFLGPDCQGANCPLITSHMESPDDGRQSCITAAERPTRTRPDVCINASLFSLQSKTCHFICPRLAPNHGDGQERGRLCDGGQHETNCKATSGLFAPEITDPLVYIQHTQRKKLTFLFYGEFRVCFCHTVE